MSSDSPPPHLLQQHLVNPGSPASDAPGSRSMPTPDISSRPGSADPAAAQGLAAENGLQSQPMTSTSSSTDLAGADSTNPSSIHAPYGTRSRGRNAARRPNYAEDRDIDMDLDSDNTQQKSAKRISGSAFSGAVNGSKNESEKSSSSNSRKAHPATNGANQASRDSIPGTSSFSAKIDDGDAQSSTSKKRKQPASAPNSNSTNGSASKKIFTTAPGLGPDQTESNMVTFDTHGAYLDDGKLKADDGSVYAPNGWSSPPEFTDSVILFMNSAYVFYSLLLCFCFSFMTLIDTWTRPCLSHLRTPGRAILLGAHYGISTFQGVTVWPD